MGDARSMELLSPAGSPEALRAAVQYGADAVYLGCGAFNARRGAKNFSAEEFAEAVAYCHLRGVKVYLTLNTLLRDRELPAAIETARLACRLGTDAILVQDWGLFSLLRRALPDQPLHASTQMSVFTTGGACEAAAMGCTRVVLARELSREDIAAICRNSPVEIEIFGHGALCMCYSGQCAMSAVLGGRSGNRGTCAQPCRLPYQVVTEEGTPLRRGTRATVAASKRCDAVATLPQGEFTSPEDVQFPEGSRPAQAERDNRGTCAQPCRLPYQVVTEEGNSPRAGQNAYPLSLKDSALANEVQAAADLGVACLKLEGRMKRPEYVAVVTEIYAALLRQRRRPTRDELSALEAAFSRSGFTQGYWTGRKGPEMFGTRPENAAEPKELFAEKKAGYEKGELRTVPIRFSCRVAAGAPACLTVCDDDGHCCTITGAVPEAARNRPLTAEEVETRLAKTGGTAFSCATVTAEVEPALSLPASAINALRRMALFELESARTAPPVRRDEIAPTVDTVSDAGDWADDPALTVSLFHPAQLSEALLAEHPARVYLPLERLADFDWKSAASQTEVWAILPRVWRDGDEAALLRRLSQADGLSGILLGNLGHFPLVRALGLPLAGDYGLNLFNSFALDWAATQGLSSATLSFELRREQLRDLRKPIATEALVYGRLPLQINENCPTGNAGGCRGDLRLCQAPSYLQDRTGVRFPLLPAFGCRSEVQNSRVLYLADRSDWKTVGLRYARLRFTDETPEDCAALLRDYHTGTSAPPPLFTRGLFDKGVD